MIDWLQVDKELENDGWTLTINKAHGQCRVTYLHIVHLPCSGNGKTIEEAALIAQSKMGRLGNENKNVDK